MFDCASMGGLLWSVAENRQPELLLAHLDAGNDPDAGEYGRTLLFIAAHQNPTAVRLLLERGADPTRRNKYGVVASTLAEGEHKDPVIRELVRRAVERRS